MAYSGIGGQAVMEGVMMKNGKDYAVAVRTPSGEIDVTKHQTAADRKNWNKVPIIRGILAFWDSMTVGMKSLMISADYFEDEESSDEGKDPAFGKNNETEKSDKPGKEKGTMGPAEIATLAFSFIIAIVIFTGIPYGVSQLLGKWITGYAAKALIEGLIRVLVFLGYILLVGRMEDIHRVFMYHGAEHKCINCIEHGLNLNLENVRKSSREHKRCGTSFIFIVLFISIFVFMFIRVDQRLLQLALRILLIPVIAGVSYEFIRLAGRSDSSIVNLLSRPGMALQRLTTAEPDDDMIEVAMASVEAVFDWKAFLNNTEETQEGKEEA